MSSAPPLLSVSLRGDRHFTAKAPLPGYCSTKPPKLEPGTGPLRHEESPLATKFSAASPVGLGWKQRQIWLVDTR